MLPNQSEPDSSTITSSTFGVDPAEVQGLITELKTRKWMATLRPIPVFVGSNYFSKPRTTTEAMGRVEANLPFFLTNYLILCAMVTVVTILLKPSLIFIGALLGVFWFWASRQEFLQIGPSIQLQGRNKMIAMTSLTGAILFIFAGTTIFFLVGICTCRQ